MKNGKNEIGPGDWFAAGGKGYKFEKIENGGAIIRDLKGNTFRLWPIETFKRMLSEIGYALAEGENE